MENYLESPNRFVVARGSHKFAYREMGNKTGRPLLLLNHLSATLDNWDPALIDELSQNRWIIVFDNSGIGLSNGTVPTKIEEMADEVAYFIEALNLQEVDLLGLSMGGFIAQDFTLKYPKMVHQLILVGTGPKGDHKIGDVGKVTNQFLLKTIFTRQDVKERLFFTTSTEGKTKAREFIGRLKQRVVVKDQKIALTAYLRQLKAIKKFANDQNDDLTKINAETLVVNGDTDAMVPTQGSYAIAQQIPNSQLKIYADAGHTSLFQYPMDFSKVVNELLK